MPVETRGDKINDPFGKERRANGSGDLNKQMQVSDPINLIGRLKRLLLLPVDPNDPVSKVVNADKMMGALMKGAMEGSITHLREVMDRVEGKVADKAVTISGNDLKEMSDDELDRALNFGSSNIADLNKHLDSLESGTVEPDSAADKGGEG